MRYQKRKCLFYCILPILVLYSCATDPFDQAYKLQRENRLEEAVKHWKLSLEKYESSKDNINASIVLGNLARNYYLQGKYKKAIFYSEQAIEKLKDVEKTNKNKESLQSGCLSRLGNAYYQLGQFSKAKEYFLKADSISREIGKGGSPGNLGAVYHLLGDFDIAEKYYLEALENCESDDLSIWYGNLYNLYLQNKKYSNAMSYNTKYAEACQKNRIKDCVRQSRINKGNILLGMGRDKEALEIFSKEKCFDGVAQYCLKKGDFQKAKTIFLHFLKSVKNEQSKSCYWIYLGQAFEGLGDYINAKIYFQKATDLFDCQKKKIAPKDQERFIGAFPGAGKIRRIDAYIALERINQAPSNLNVSLSFSDSKGCLPNNTIDAGEQSRITATITNKGKGTAFDVKLNTECDFSCVEFDKVIDIGDIPPGESRTLKVKLYGQLDLKDGIAPFLLQCTEKRGFDSEKIKLNIPTAHLEKPDIVIADYKINDGKTGLASGNGNGIPENGETIELTAFVKNNGVGRAIKVDLCIASINSGVEVTRKQTEIAQILPGQTMSGKLAFAIPRTYSGGDIRVALKASDVRGASDGVKQLALNVNTIGPVLAYSYNITDRNGNGFVENGETCELEILITNKGQMEARRISIKVDSADLSFSRNRVELGRLETDSANIPIRFSFTVPRTLEKESVGVEVQLTQAEFPGLTENINVPIKVSRPEFAITHQILDPNGNGVIEQGESVELVVRVKNTGQLDAADVNLSINIDQKGIILTSAKEFSIGRIQAGRESDPIRFMITVQRSVPAGDLLVSFKIAQKDFKSRDLVLALNVAPEKAKEITVAGQKPASDYRPVSPAGRFKMAPHVVITTPRDGKRVVTDTIDLRGIAADDRGVVSIDINVNGMRIDLHDRGIAVKGNNTQREFYAAVPLRTGRNEIVVTALDNENLASEPKSITVFYEKEKGEIWAAVIGINNYHHVQKLDYAKNDASAFADYLRTNLDIEADHLFELYDGHATKRNIQSLLGTQIRSKAGHEDTVIIFFAGHGAPEESETSLDGDGIEKYILPCDANTTDLYTTAIPMDEIARIFRRIKAERIILLADCCYSGQTGGRTILSKTRANISDAFLDRLSKGKGRIIITASSASEVSKESDDLKHGYFTYYLLKGLKGAADVDGDGFIDVNEISSYLNREVPKATGQRQHPVKKGEAEGQVVIGRVR